MYNIHICLTSTSNASPWRRFWAMPFETLIGFDFRSFRTIFDAQSCLGESSNNYHNDCNTSQPRERHRHGRSLNHVPGCSHNCKRDECALSLDRQYVYYSKWYKGLGTRECENGILLFERLVQHCRSKRLRRFWRLLLQAQLSWDYALSNDHKSTSSGSKYLDWLPSINYKLGQSNSSFWVPATSAVAACVGSSREVIIKQIAYVLRYADELEV